MLITAEKLFSTPCQRNDHNKNAWTASDRSTHLFLVSAQAGGGSAPPPCLPKDHRFVDAERSYPLIVRVTTAHAGSSTVSLPPLREAS